MTALTVKAEASWFEWDGIGQPGHLPFVEQGPTQMFLCIKAVDTSADWLKQLARHQTCFSRLSSSAHLCG